MDRRSLLKVTGAAFAALLAGGGIRTASTGTGYGPLVRDPAGLLDLPEGFSYRVLSQLGDRMDDGLFVPDKADGMGCFALADGRIALVRNHELSPGEESGGALSGGFDQVPGGAVLPGGTTTLVLDPRSLAVERQYRSLAGTIRNCAGGTTPWGSWLTCEETVERAGVEAARDHGWVFEVPADAQGLAQPVPLTAMGRFRHEACAVDPATGIVYMTEDHEKGLFYRFIPAEPGRLANGGRLQALALPAVLDTRNWGRRSLKAGQWASARWIDLDQPESPDDDLRERGAAAGAAIFARGEGLHMGEGELYFCCTSGGAARLGQVFRLSLPHAGQDRLQLFFESRSRDELAMADNLVVAPNRHLIVCEDQASGSVDNHLRGIAPGGKTYPLARLRKQTELAGACFAPDGKTLFVNVFSPAMTVAVTGPWLA